MRPNISRTFNPLVSAFLLSSLLMPIVVGGCGSRQTKQQAEAPPSNATWLKGSGGADKGYYQWLSPHSYFCLAPPHAERSGVVWVVSGAAQPVVVDANTGKQRRLTVLTKMFGAGDNALFNHASHWKASPDGKWLLFLTHGTSQRAWMAVSTDGKRIVQRPPKPAAQSFFCNTWMPDSRHWAEVVRDGDKYEVVTYSFDAPGYKTYPIVWSKDVSQMYFHDPGILVLGFTSNNHLLTKGEANDSYTPYFDLALKNNAAVERIVPRKEVNSGFLFDVVLSPDGKRLAWRSGDQSLCVSNIDGSNEHIVVKQINDSTAVRWVPDSKHVSFCYGYSLYTAPVD